MPKIRRRGLAQGGELPGTLKRSSKEAQETFTKARDSAVRTYGEGDQADRAAYAEFKRKFEKRGDHWIPKRSADSGELALTSLHAVPSSRRRSPPCMRWRGPRLVPGRPGRLAGRLAPVTARRGRASARTAGFPAPPASRSHLRMMPVSNGEIILTVPAGRPQGSAGIHFWFFRRPHFIHRRCLVIRIIRRLSTDLCTARPQVPWITSEIAVGSIFSRARRRDGRRRCTAAGPARICR
jgi:ChaB protein